MWVFILSCCNAINMYMETFRYLNKFPVFLHKFFLPIQHNIISSSTSNKYKALEQQILDISNYQVNVIYHN